jgi:Holliday junction resolvase RusA-like endonuclease
VDAAMSKSVPRDRINDDGSREIHLVILGVPEPQGSTRAFAIKRKGQPTGQVVVTSSNKKVKPWRQQVGWVAKEAMKGAPFYDEAPISLNMNFYFQKPKSLRGEAWAKVTKPDVDKLARAILDSLTGILYRDDSQVIGLDAQKSYDAVPRVEIGILVHRA